MKSILVHSYGLAPKLTKVPAPALPTDPSILRLQVLATGVHQVVKSRAAGEHYSALTSALPFNAGVDGVGRTVDGGKLVYFSTLSSGQGSFSEIINVPKMATVELDEGADPVQVAGLTNPVMSSWMALKTRTDSLPTEFTVLIMGVTSASGRVAIEVARQLGAGKVIGVARNADAMQELSLNETIVLQKEAKGTDFGSASEADVILDYLGGEPTKYMLESLKMTKPVQWIQIGGLASSEISISGAALRSNNLTMRGSGPGAWSMQQLGKEMPDVVKIVQALSRQKMRVSSFDDAETAWNESGDRLVFVP